MWEVRNKNWQIGRGYYYSTLKLIYLHLNFKTVMNEENAKIRREVCLGSKNLIKADNFRSATISSQKEFKGHVLPCKIRNIPVRTDRRNHSHQIVLSSSTGVLTSRTNFDLIHYYFIPFIVKIVFQRKEGGGRWN